VRDRIRDDDSRIVERLIVLVLAFWMGGLMMVTIAATGSFKAVEVSLDKPSAGVAKAMSKLGQDQTRDLLHYQSSEVNRQLFEVWGWLQLGLTGASLAALLFMTNVGKRALAISAGMAGLSALMTAIIIPGMIRIGREMRASPLGPSADMAQSFRTMHQAFGAFEAVAVILALWLMVGLLRGGSRARR
jgi:hypothetical protein